MRASRVLLMLMRPCLGHTNTGFLPLVPELCMGAPQRGQWRSRWGSLLPLLSLAHTGQFSGSTRKRRWKQRVQSDWKGLRIMRAKKRMRVTIEVEGGSNPWRLRLLQTVSFTSPNSRRPSRSISVPSKTCSTIIPQHWGNTNVNLPPQPHTCYTMPLLFT